MRHGGALLLVQARIGKAHYPGKERLITEVAYLKIEPKTAMFPPES